MSMSSNGLVGRPHSTTRLRSASVGAVLLAIGLGLLLRSNPVGAVFLLAGGLLLADLWRCVRVEGERLVVQGRVTRHALPLRDIAQVGLSTMGRPWVAPRQGRPLYLRMVSEGQDLVNPGVHEFVTRLREEARAAGAALDEQPDAPTPPPPGARPLFTA
ncbi:hypothetical protein I601_1124 [Nocardioides dokdonensis FR1436]|uniref:PH domain-containing protein n=1 Tax=Nocardioides dokdonensis FR1436 TaxID=1300347 RepID=A0A1A9GHL8_9ACTN|nr:hypothetical protein [Nocardioides dokdonensis]ANH37566.1 hypothetical protein I601_1124 [Nocardioides dokdonensis FR1436]